MEAYPLDLGRGGDRGVMMRVMIELIQHEYLNKCTLRELQSDSLYIKSGLSPLSPAKAPSLPSSTLLSPLMAVNETDVSHP